MKPKVVVRPPVVAGMFYSHGKNELQKEVEGLFKQAKKRQTKQDCIGVVSPHAGYAYSGRTAALAIGSLRPAKSFILLGPNHNVMGARFAVMKQGSWSTPLGDCRLDSSLAGKIKCSFLQEDPAAHSMEHSIEVQLPFLQHRFKQLSIVPIAITNLNYSDDFLGRCEELGKVIATVIKNQQIGIVASSDFCHYVPARVADRIDSEAIKRITRLDARGFFEHMEKNMASICGFGAIAVLMSVAKQLGLRGRLLDYTNSGESTGDKGSVVGYAAIGFG